MGKFTKIKNRFQVWWSRQINILKTTKTRQSGYQSTYWESIVTFFKLIVWILLVFISVCIYIFYIKPFLI